VTEWEGRGPGEPTRRRPLGSTPEREGTELSHSVFQAVSGGGGGFDGRASEGHDLCPLQWPRKEAFLLGIWSTCRSRPAG